ncbi:hypothetical protein BVU17_18650 (plasmid) [Haloarcula taiwanensis]|uniref:Uncharacterized protein n=1 Tax=Haloarcula taiwanensis TaxID=1932004 RepID=A0A2H5A4H9_9EURY|nr:hypothetical protein [Haloarcula taiwanensis]AUG49590.1 hypothetical protein BVU17_18650 [Haloarcula taiwanensis]
MAESTESELSIEDIEFLTIVRDVSDNPDEYDGTELGEAPATVTVITDNTSLSKSQVKYRLNSESDAGNSRGFTEDQLGYIKSYGASMTEKGWGPRSCEITEKGREALDEVTENSTLSLSTSKEGSPAGGSTERIEELAEDIERLDNQLAAMGARLTEATEAIEEFNEAEFGAVDEEMSHRLESALDAMITYKNIFEYVLGTDVRPFHPDENGMIDAEMVAEGREQVVAAINATSESDAAEELRRK